MAEALVQTEQKQQRLIKPLRTYEDDVARFVKNKKVSTSTIMLAEQNRRLASKQKEKTVKNRDKKTFWIRISIILTLIGFAVLVFAFVFFNPETGVVNFNYGPQDIDDALIDKKDEVIIDSTGRVPLDVKNAVITAIQAPPFLNKGEIAEIKIVADKTDPVTNKTTQAKVSVSEMLNFLELNTPGQMTRSLGDEYLLGLFGLETKTTPFILIKVDDFDQVFSGLLDWEISMFRQVNDLFFEKLPKSDFVVAQGKTDLTKLTDGVISNRDARAIVDENGQVLFYYTFVNDDHLLLAERTEIVNEIATKLNLKNLVR
jgi:hypothetical protein